ncbi:MAG: Dihydrolipoyl dehydrogenase [Phycisphaerae bacterium]|nr:Dihydrolipoyl dehydrogenase [Phycisphaerae bacterium]
MSESNLEFDVVVIGAGPGGYVAAIRAAQLGLRVACVDENKALGGTCLRVGCIPSKAMLESSEKFAETRDGLAVHGVKVADVQLDLAAMLKRKERIVSTLTTGVKSLFKKNDITAFTGKARLAGGGRVVVSGDGETTLNAKNVIIATGSRSADLRGVELDGDRIGTSTEALGYPEVPGHLAVIGAGYIGMELGSVWRRLGAKVTMIEYLDRILPGTDAEIAAAAKKLFDKQGFEFQLGAKVTAARRDGDGCVVEYELEGAKKSLACDRVLLAVGRTPNTEGLDLAAAGVELTDKGRVKVDAQFRTTAAGVYAIGDVIGGAMLAHKAEEEGIACAEQIARGVSHVDYHAIPAVVYTHPEIAAVGRTEEQLVADGVGFRKGAFPFRANGRARTLDDVEGMVKVLADANTDRLLGVHILGPRAGDLIAEAAVAMAFDASAEDLALSCHAHPTLSEALKEAAMAVAGRAIHF